MPGDYSEELVELVRQDWYSHTFADPRTCRCGYKPPTGDDWTVHRLVSVLDALSSSGRLVPEGSEVREEWGNRFTWVDSGHTEDVPATSRYAAESSELWHEEQVAANPAWVGRAPVLRRLIITTPWFVPDAETITDQAITKEQP